MPDFLSPVAQTPEKTGFLLLLIYFPVIFSVQDRGKSTPRMTWGVFNGLDEDHYNRYAIMES